METKKRYTFDPVCDIAPVTQYGGIDLRVLTEQHAVPAGVAASSVDYNNIEEPGQVLGRPRDCFDEIAMQKAVKTYKPANKEAAGDYQK